MRGLIQVPVPATLTVVVPPEIVRAGQSCLAKRNDSLIPMMCTTGTEAT
jgi:hypothetical protein